MLKYIGCAVYLGRQPLFSKANAQRLQFEGLDVWVERIVERNASPFIVFRAVRTIQVKDQIGFFTAEAFDPLKEIITEKDPGPPGVTWEHGPKAGTIVIRKEIEGRGWYSVSLPHEGIAVFPGNDAPGWRAWIDGQRTEVFEANLFAKGVLVPAGNHEIVLRYLPASFLWGAIISLASIGIIPAGALHPRHTG